ncbi:aminoacyl-tRNA deacylase [Bacteroidota bacterium]
MPAKKIKEFLDGNNVKYVAIKHSLAYTAQEIAATAHIKGKELAKTVLVKIDGKLAMTVCPASYKIDLSQLKEAVGAKKVRLANEQEFKDKFSECDVGAMPPFGNLYNMDVFVAESLSDEEEIAFNAGSHTELIKLAYNDFERLVKPRKVKCSFQSKT